MFMPEDVWLGRKTPASSEAAYTAALPLTGYLLANICLKCVTEAAPKKKNLKKKTFIFIRFVSGITYAAFTCCSPHWKSHDFFFLSFQCLLQRLL